MKAHIQVKQHGIKQCDLHDGLRSADPQRRNAATATWATARVAPTGDSTHKMDLFRGSLARRCWIICV